MPTVLTTLSTQNQPSKEFFGETNYERALRTYRNDNGVPQLIAALKAKDEDAAKALLDGGEDPNEVDEKGKNALHVAAWKGCRLPLFNRILGMIRNVNAGDMYGQTALIWAVDCKHLDMVVSLMNHPEIDVNAQDQSYWTALHFAVYNNHIAILEQLLSDDRIDTSIKGKYTKETPLEYAISHWGHTKCEMILRDHGAGVK